MNTRIFVMAQGKGTRWLRNDRTTIENPCEYKQIIPITEDENLICRTIRQLGKDANIKVICNEEFSNYLPVDIEIESFKEPIQPILHGIWSTKKEWINYDSVLIILGDVAFSNSGMQKILNANKNLRDNKDNVTIFGRLGNNKISEKEAREIFAVSILPPKYVEVKNNMAVLWEIGHQKLWDYYKIFDPKFIEIDDYTDDVDSLEAYVKFWPKMLEKILEDDK